MKLVIVNTGCANISSVKFAIERLGYEVTVSDDPAVISDADKLFLPGVGTATAAMNSMNNKQLVELVCQLQQPVLGICLGMQLLTTFSEEGDVSCLGKIDASVKRCKWVIFVYLIWAGIRFNILTGILSLPIFRNTVTFISCIASALLLENTPSHMRLCEHSPPP